MENLPSTPSDETLFFEHLPIRVKEIDYFEIFSHPQENLLFKIKLKKIILLLFFLISKCWECFIHIQRNISIMFVF